MTGQLDHISVGETELCRLFHMGHKTEVLMKYRKAITATTMTEMSKLRRQPLKYP